MKCPVCNKKFNGKTGLNNHLFKKKNTPEHIEFVKKLNEEIIKCFYNYESCITVNKKFSLVSNGYICNIWRQLPEYEERKIEMHRRRAKRNWPIMKENLKKHKSIPYSKKKYTVKKEIYEKIISYIDSDLSAKKIAKICNCNEKTVAKIFIKEFGKEKYDEYVIRVRKSGWKSGGNTNSLKVKDPKRYEMIINDFNTDIPIRELVKKYKTWSIIITKCWKEKFGEIAVSERKCKMLKLQKIHAAENNPTSAKFVGSKNEILCYELLFKKYGEIVCHHDYSIVPYLEIDISIKSKNIVITWDGPGHRRPIYGSICLKKTLKNDKIREDFFKKFNWKHISVIDDGNYDPKFVESSVDKIIKLISQNWSGKKEI